MVLNTINIYVKNIKRIQSLVSKFHMNLILCCLSCHFSYFLLQPSGFNPGCEPSCICQLLQYVLIHPVPPVKQKPPSRILLRAVTSSRCLPSWSCYPRPSYSRSSSPSFLLPAAALPPNFLLVLASLPAHKVGTRLPHDPAARPRSPPAPVFAFITVHDGRSRVRRSETLGGDATKPGPGGRPPLGKRCKCRESELRGEITG